MLAIMFMTMALARSFSAIFVDLLFSNYGMRGIALIASGMQLCGVMLLATRGTDNIKVTDRGGWGWEERQI